MREEHNDLCVGIDLGTTNSVLATVNVKLNGNVVSKVVDIARGVDIYSNISGEAKLSTQKKPTLPSCVYYREEKEYEPLVGDFAKMQYSIRPHLVAKSIKSQMGKPFAEGLCEDIPDKTPAKISANILRHMLKEAKKIYHCEMDDAVITVPANFDSAMCKATRDAAELAGIKIMNEDGSERPILLSEPNAVIYDLINQIQNGEIASQIIDLSSEKNVLVFDLGGGTLDITLHKIVRREDCPEVLKVSEIATNRYTLLGGDDFDRQIAEDMYKRYTKQYEAYPNVLNNLKQQKKIIMSQLIDYAEQLKIDLNERYLNTSEESWEVDDWGDDNTDTFDVGGNMGGIGYAFDTVYTKKEIEDILETFMGRHLTVEDYKRVNEMVSGKDTRNIIYPILDVLQKSAAKNEGKRMIVDAVVVNGGMSKFYMVAERLKEFFGFDPIIALDPDQAVARGAAIYHYYLHKHEQIQDDMRLIGNADFAERDKNDVFSLNGIEFGKSILNDSLYLGLKNGVDYELISTGEELPFQSDVQTGFELVPGSSMIAIPIKSKNIDGSYRTIAKGKIELQKKYYNGAYLAFTIKMNEDKVLTMKAWTSSTPDGGTKLEQADATIIIDNTAEAKGSGTRVAAPKGSILKPKEEINNLLQMHQNLKKTKGKGNASLNAKKIAAEVSAICAAGNPEEFADPILEAFDRVNDENVLMKLFIIARKICKFWKEEQQKKLEKVCIEQLLPQLQGFSVEGKRTSVHIQAIYTLSACSDHSQLKKLDVLRKNAIYIQACLYTYAKTRTNLEWIYEEFISDKNKAMSGISNHIQFSAYAMGIALRKEEEYESNIKEKEVVKNLCELLSGGKMSGEELLSCILAIGWICDQRVLTGNSLTGQVVDDAWDAVQKIDAFFSDMVLMKARKAQEIVKKMIKGEILNSDEEEFLSDKIEF